MITFVCFCALLLVALIVLCIFIVGGVDFVYMCGFIIIWVRLCFWLHALACVYVFCLILRFAFFVIGDAFELLMRTL